MTFSINTNNSSMAALQSLRTTAADLAKTEKQVATGLAVGSASDNPAVYAIAQQMNGNISGLAAVSSSLAFGAQVVSTASSASSSMPSGPSTGSSVWINATNTAEACCHAAMSVAPRPAQGQEM